MTDAVTIEDHIIAPLANYYNDSKVVEIRMQKPQQVIVDARNHDLMLIDDEKLTLDQIERICTNFSNLHGGQYHADKMPQLSCILPGGHRFECVTGNSTRGKVSLAIRVKSHYMPEWSEIGLCQQAQDYLQQAVINNSNIIVSGATNTGKTTLLNKILAYLPDDRRVVSIEDTPELDMGRFWNGTSLLASRDGTDGNGMLSYRQLSDHCKRITPDHIIFGEISITNSFAVLDALNSGVTGIMFTIHAESPHQAINRKFTMNIAWAGHEMQDVPEYLRELIDVVVQIKRNNDGMRRITDIYEVKNDKYILQNGVML